MHLPRASRCAWRLPLSCLVLVLAFAATGARGAEAVSGFYAGKAFKPLYVSKDTVAVRHSPTVPHWTVKLEPKAAAAFRQLGLDVMRRTSLLPDDVVVGYPVTFDKDAGAVGVLTHEVVVRTASARGAARIRAAAGFAALTVLPFKPNLFVAKFTSPMAALAAANALYKDKDIVYAHPNFMVPKDFRAAPEGAAPQAEPFFASQWHLENTGQFGGTPGADIHAKAAWDITQGDRQVIVAVLDGGFEVTHPDLQGAWWHNPGEIPGNGVDDDHDGYVDDVLGWNFHLKNNDLTAGVVPDHGTAVAGLVGARVNGKGVTGVCPLCTVLPIVVAWTPVDDAAAFYYAEKHGAKVITSSWGYPVGTPTTDVVTDAVNDVAANGRGGKGTIILFAMNNIDQDDCSGKQPDISSLDAVVAISASNDQDVKVASSAWGSCMKLLSPTFDEGRRGIATTDLTAGRGYNDGKTVGELPDTDYTDGFGGTSAATPVAAGVFALMLSVNDHLTSNEALALALATADKINPTAANYDAKTGFSPKYGYGRINAGRAVSAAQVFRQYSQRQAPATGLVGPPARF